MQVRGVVFAIGRKRDEVGRIFGNLEILVGVAEGSLDLSVE
jgi:hypothetical protein